MRYSAIPASVTFLAIVLLGLRFFFPDLARRHSRATVVLPTGFAPDGSRFAPLAPVAPPAPDTTQPLLEQVREVAPGLVVVLRGTPVSDDPAAKPQRILIIKRGGHVIYADTTVDFLYSPGTTDASSRRYPLWVPTGPGRGELLVRVASPPGLDIVRRFQLSNQLITSVYTLPAFDEAARNLDGDPLPEYGGYRYTSEVWGDSAGHFWTSYNPKLYYEVRPGGLVFDSALTRRRARARYGVFRGFRYSNKPGVRVHAAPR